ncbi:folate-binding protein YgfZ [Polynucleobacter sp. AP-Nino-20-G2]|uniref:CAF17-like 4Fe-4S cluster assembly/insertion protein YgfZ n=1 Tax=Polynucleobacter sp. AP-Nino-20-G2 TaxID=2576917 RepID=UPI001BFDD612|nr:folate-binding protein [Polynucleobacter sp. AP-Nino-20-G2]QWE15733.1 folate-binding protein YgfZ [Polynucleobacter sp. AP-Nino-20-G2]
MTLTQACNTTALADWGLILVEGADAASFLQNQLTNSVLGLTGTKPGEIAAGHASTRLVGYCNPKGRLLASAWIALYFDESNSENRFALFISKDIASSIAKRLSMFVLRSKVKVIDVSQDWEISGIYEEGQAPLLSPERQQSLALQLPDVLSDGKTFKRVLIAQSKETHANPMPNESALAQWNSLEVLSGIPRIVLATQEQFIPQMINFESVYGVDFKKGCYPGQEIVARSQYRGAVKRRLQLAHADSTDSNLALSMPGVELFHSDDTSQPCGMVVLAAPNPSSPSRIDYQIECKLDALETGVVYLGSNNSAVLKIDSLPYPLVEI